jgi:cation-transporting P-type ATPase I
MMPTLSPLLGCVAQRRRQLWAGAGRAHVEHREVPPGQQATFEAAVRAELGEELGVEPVGFLLRPPRVVVEYDSLWTTSAELSAAIDRAEAVLGELVIPLGRPSHPGDREPITRFATQFGLDLGALALGLTGRGIGWPPPRLEVDLARLVTIVEHTPELRAAIERRLGPHGTDVVLGAASAVLQGLAQAMTGPIVDAAHRSLLLAEQGSRRRAWAAWEPTVAAAASPSMAALAAGRRHHRRPPDGDLEQYARRTLEASLAAFASGLVTTGDLGQALAPVVDALPKAARLGREAFAAQLARELAERGTLVMDRQALRRLDRVDTIVLDGRLLLATTPSGRLARPARPTAVGRDLLAAASAAGLRTVVSGRSAVAEDADARVPTHLGIAAAIAGLQAEDHSVLAVVLEQEAAIAGADVSIGVTRARTDARAGHDAPDAPAAPVGADLLVGDDLDAVCLLVEAVAAARTHTEQTVRIGIAGTILGAAALVGRPRRDATAVAARALDAAALAAIVNGVRAARALPRTHLPLRHAPPPWHALEVDDVLRRLRTSSEGLTAAQAEERRPPAPAVPSLPDRFVRAVAEELATPLTPVLAAGAGLSLATGSAVDAGLVSLVLGINAALGAAQRLQAGAAVAALDDHRGRTVTVRRPDGPETVERGELAVGDVLELLPGDVLPADARILAAAGLLVDGASLTGEADPVSRSAATCDADRPVADRTSMLYAGSMVVAGEATAVVVALGDDTLAGRAAARSREQVPVTGVDRRLAELTDLTIPVALGGSAGILVAGLMRRQPLAEVTATAVNLAVAAVPEGLPLLASVAQRGAARRLSRHGTVVRDARAVEALGRVDVLCIDKTGTLTEGQLRLTQVSDGETLAAPAALDEAHRRVLLAARRATPIRADGRVAHLTDGAVAAATREAGIRREGTGGFEHLAALPFEPGRSYHAVLARTHRGQVLTVKGAPETILERSTRWARNGTGRRLDGAGRAGLLAHAEQLARQGLRVLAVAEREVVPDRHLTDDLVAELTLLGFVGLRDPVRASASEAIAQLRAAGLRVVMVTGDHAGTAEAVAAELGLTDGQVLSGAQLDLLDDAGLDAVLDDVGGFSRVVPEQKVRIVQAYQRAGHVVAMTGDGANDAPAIRLADVGIALGPQATTAARRSAELIVTDDRIETIAAAIAEGRGLWASVRDAVAVLIGGNLGEIGYTLAGSVLGGTSPLNARQLLMVNLLTDALPSLAIASAPPDGGSIEQLLREGPEASLGFELDRSILWRGIGTGIGAAVAYVPARLTGTRAHASTTGLAALVGAQLLQTAIARTRQPRVLAAGLGSAVALGVVVQTPGLSGLTGCRPLGPVGWTLAGTGATLGTAIGVLGPRVERLVRRRDSGPASGSEQGLDEPVLASGEPAVELGARVQRDVEVGDDDPRGHPHLAGRHAG